MLLAALLALQAAAPAGPLAGDWLPIHEQDGARLEVDEGATSRDGDLVRVRLRWALPGGAPDGARWAIIHMELNCRSRTGRELSIQTYGADGGPAGDSHAQTAGEPRAPRTEAARQFLEATCHRTGWGGEGEAE